MTRVLRLVAGLLRLWWSALTEPVLLLSGGAGLGLAAALALALTVWARCSDLGPVVHVLPVVVDAGARAR